MQVSTGGYKPKDSGLMQRINKKSSYRIPIDMIKQRMSRRLWNFVWVKMVDVPAITIVVKSIHDFKRRKAAIKEPETIEWMEKCVTKFQMCTLIDIGANVGGYSLIFCSKNKKCKAIAIEPFPPTFLSLCTNIIKNRLSHQIIPLHGFVGDTSQSVSVPLKFEEWLSGVAEHKDSGKHMISVPVLDSNIIKRFLSPRCPIICKIDVDGAEIGVLDGLADLISDQNLYSILIECEKKNLETVEIRLAHFGLTIQSRWEKMNQQQVNIIAYRAE